MLGRVRVTTHHPLRWASRLRCWPAIDARSPPRPARS